MNAGDCYWAHTGIDRDGEETGHLFVILLDPVGQDQLTVSVPCTTIRGGPYDKTCELEAGCHPFIRNRSYIRYNFADVESVNDINGKIAQGLAKMREPMDPNILEAIKKGLLKSKHTRRWVKRWYHDQIMDDLFNEI